MKLALLFAALLLALSLLSGELAMGDASGCVLLPFTFVLTLGGSIVVLVFGKGRARFVAAALILLMGLHIAFGPLYYRGAEIESRVVDEQGDPVADAKVVATWETTQGVTFARSETRTDRGGSFTIAPWGPRLRPPFATLDPSQPTITVQAPGYALAEERDDSLGERVAALVGEQWRKEIVVYKP